GSPRQPGPFAAVLRQRVRLPLGDHLHPVLEAAQEEISVPEVVAIAAGDEARIQQPVEGAERAPLAQVPVLAAMEQLERLDEELHLANAAGAELEIEPAAPACFALGAGLERAHFLDGTEIQVLAPDERSELAQGLFADGDVAGNRTRLEQGETLPGGSLRFVIQLERPGGVRDRAASPFRPQIEIDAEDEAAWWRGARRPDGPGDLLGEPGVEGEVVDGRGALRAAVGVVDVENVDIAREVQFAAAELPHSEHAEPARTRGGAAVRRAVLLAQFRVMERDRRLQRGLGETGKLGHRFRQGRAAGQIAQCDAENLDELAPAQRLRQLDPRPSRGNPPAGRFGKAGAGEQIDEAR